MQAFLTQSWFNYRGGPSYCVELETKNKDNKGARKGLLNDVKKRTILAS